MKRQSLPGKILAYLIFLIICAVILLPIMWMFFSSFRTDVEIFKYNTPFSIQTFIPVNWTIQSYKNIFLLRNFGIPLRNSLIVSAICIFSGCVINGLAGFAFAKYKFTGRNILFSMVMLSFMIPFEALAIPLYGMVNKLGLVDTFIAIITPGIADGMVIFLFRQFFEDIPDSLIDAGRIDGANLPQILIRLIIPLSTPVIVTAGLVVFISNWNAFIWPLIIAHTPSLKLIQVALTDFKLEHAMLWSELFAASTISTVLPIILFMPFQKYYIQGISTVGIKG